MKARILIIILASLLLPAMTLQVYATEEVECGARNGTVADEDCGPLGDCGNGKCTYAYCPTTGPTADIVECLRDLCNERGDCYCYQTPNSPESVSGGHPSLNCGDDRECRKADPNHPFGWCRRPRAPQPAPTAAPSNTPPVECRKGTTDCADLKTPKLKNPGVKNKPGYIQEDFDEEDRDSIQVKPKSKTPLEQRGYVKEKFNDEEGSKSKKTTPKGYIDEDFDDEE